MKIRFGQNLVLLFGLSLLISLTAEVRAGDSPASDFPWVYSYEGDVIPQAADPGWIKLYASEPLESVKAGILTIKSTREQQARFELDEPQEYWGVLPEVGSPAIGVTLESRVRVVDSVGPDCPAAMLSFYSEGYRMFLHLFPDKITISGGSGGKAGVCAMDTTDKFHVYRITAIGSNIKLYADNNPAPVIDLANGLSPATKSSRIYFGDADSARTGGESQWDYLRWTNKGVYPPASK